MYHMHCGINPIQLYDDHGIAAYDLSGGSQSPWQSYYYIKEACKKQSPKLLIFDTYMVGAYQEVDHYQDYQTVANLLNFPISMNKFYAVMESYADSRLNILLWFPKIPSVLLLIRRFLYRRYPNQYTYQQNLCAF